MLSGFLAEEDEFDRRALWRLGTWGVASVAAVVIAVMANQQSLGLRRDQMATADLVQQANRLQTVAKDSQNEARRLASAVETLNGDRDRLYSRVTVLEQGLDSVTGAIAKQHPRAGHAAGPRIQSQPAPVVGPVATTPAAPGRKSPRSRQHRASARQRLQHCQGRGKDSRTKDTQPGTPATSRPHRPRRRWWNRNR